MLSSWSLPDGTTGCSLELLWMDRAGDWHGIWASGATYEEALAKAHLALGEALAEEARLAALAEAA